MTDERTTGDDGEPLRGTDAEVVAQLVENHRRFLDFVEGQVGDRGDAEEILQSAFVRGVERAGTVRDAESAVAWFYRLLRNAIVDHRRRAGTVRGSTIALGDADDELASAPPEDRAAACRCVLGLAETLEPRYADAIRRVDVEGAAVREYAAEAGITANNASMRLFRARAALKQRVSSTCRTCADHGCLDCTCRPAGGSPPLRSDGDSA